MANTISPTVLLAATVKLKKIFEREDKFLSFPGSLGFSYRYLEFMKDPTTSSLSAQDRCNNQSDFAKLLNMIPEDRSVFSQDASQSLANVFQELLIHCTFPTSGLTSAEEQQLNEAIDFLTDEVIKDGIKVPIYSPAVVQYYQYKTLYEQAERTYLDEQLTVQLSSGAEAELLKQRWQQFREKELRAFKDKATQDWITLGFKQQVESYQALKNQLEIKKYLHSYRQSCLNDLAISEINDINGRGIGFHTTFFSPSDAFNQELPWTSITLTKTEINALMGETPADLKAMFGNSQDSAEIESISLEYNNVVIIRPWFRQEFFASRFWKLLDDTLVSNGQIPSQGTIPAYISSMIVARNICITRKKQANQPPVQLPPIPIFRPPVLVTQLETLSTDPILTPLASDASTKLSGKAAVGLSNLNLAQPMVTKPIASQPIVSKPIVSKPDLSTPIVSKPITSKPIASQPITSKPDLSTPIVLKPDVLKLNLNQRISYTDAKYKGLSVTTLPNKGLVKPKPPENPEIITESLNLNGISVLAFVCKRIPKSPNPDPSLQW